MQIKGVVTPLVTPVTGRTGEIDTDALKTHTERQRNAGIAGLFPCGTAGEFPSLTDLQRATVIETVVAASGDLPVLAGCGGTSVQGVLDRIRQADSVGADAAVVVTPYYYGVDSTQLLDFYRTIANASPLPIIAYEIPELTGGQLTVEDLLELAGHESVIGVKDTTRDIVRLQRLIQRTNDEFLVFQGDTVAAATSIWLGADALVPISSNVIPRVTTAMYAAFAGGKSAEGQRLLTDIVIPFIDTFSTVPTLPAIKYLTGRSGQSAGPPLAPLPELTTNQKQQLDAGLDSLPIDQLLAP